MNELGAQSINLIDYNHNSFFYSDEHYQWISSQGGWNKYNGLETTHYLINDNDGGLRGTWIQSGMTPDKNRILWTSTYEYLCYYDELDEKFTCFHPIIDGDTINREIRVIHYLEDTDELLIRANKSLYKYSLSHKIYQPLIENETTNGVVFCATYDDNQFRVVAASWILNNNIEFWNYKNSLWEKNTFDFSTCNNELSRLQISDIKYFKGEYWLISNLGLIELNQDYPCQSKVYKLNDNNHNFIKGIINDGYLFITADFDGLVIFELSTRTFTKNIDNNNPNTPLLNNIPDYIAQSSRDLLLSYHGEGLQIIPKQELLSHCLFNNELDALRDHKIITSDKDFLVTSNRKSEIFIFDSTFNLYDKINLPKEKVLRNIVINGYDLYYSDENSIWKYNLKNKTTHNLYNNLSININKISFEYDKLYVLANTKLYIFENNELFPVYISAQGLEHYKIINNEMFIYSLTTLLNIREQDDTKTINTRIKINDLAYDTTTQDVIIALADGLGIISLKDYSFKKVSINNTKIQKIVEPVGLPHYLLITTGGLYHLNQDYQFSKIHTNNEAVIDCSAFQNHLLYTTKSGLFTLQLKSITYERTDSLIIASSTYSYKIYKDEVYYKYSIKSTPPSLNLRSNNLTNNKYGLYSYTIDGKDDATFSSITSTLALPYLTEGKHILEIQGHNLDMTNSNKIVLHIHVIGPIYRQWWFILLIIVVVSLFTWYYTRLKTLRLEEQLRIKEEINQLEKSALQAQMNPHFIFNCLNSIQSFIMDNDKEKAMDYLGRFAQLIRGNLNASINPTILLSEEIRILESYLSLEQLRLNHRFSYSLQYSKNIDIHSTRIAPMLIQPFVENAVIHGMRSIAKDGIIKINFTLKENVLEVKVQDNGIKIDGNQSPSDHKSVGISITNKRLSFLNSSSSEELNTTINHAPSGTTALISIKL